MQFFYYFLCIITILSTFAFVYVYTFYFVISPLIWQEFCER